MIRGGRRWAVLPLVATVVSGCNGVLLDMLTKSAPPGQQATQPGGGSQALAGKEEATSSVREFRPLEEGPYVMEVAKDAPYSPGSSVGPDVVFSPDGKHYAYGLSSGDQPPALTLGEVGGPVQQAGARPDGGIWWAPDGRRVAFAETVDPTRTTYALRTAAAASGEIEDLGLSVTGRNLWVGWSAAGVLFTEDREIEGTGFRDLQLFHLPGGSIAAPARLASVLDARPSGAPPIYPSPDGRQVAYLAGIPGFMEAAALTLLDLQSGQSRMARRVAKTAPAMVWDPAGSQIAYLSGSIDGLYELHRIRVSDGSDEVTPFDLGPPDVTTWGNGTSVVGYTAANLSPDLKWCTVAKGESPLYARELATGRHTQITPGPARVLSWTADSRFLFLHVRGDRAGQSRYYKVQVPR